MRPEDIRAFARRSWADAERAKRDHWLSVTHREGPAAVLRIADALREHVKRFAAEALAEQRRIDWDHHLELKRRLDAASNRLGR